MYIYIHIYIYIYVYVVVYACLVRETKLKGRVPNSDACLPLVTRRMFASRMPGAGGWTLESRRPPAGEWRPCLQLGGVRFLVGNSIEGVSSQPTNLPTYQPTNLPTLPTCSPQRQKHRQKGMPAKKCHTLMGVSKIWDRHVAPSRALRGDSKKGP